MDATTCAVRYLDPWLPEVARAEVDCGPGAERLDVLALPPPLRGQAVTPSSGRALLAFLLVVLLGPAAVGTALRVRRRAAGSALGESTPTDGEER